MEIGRGYSKRNLWLMLEFYELKEKNADTVCTIIMVTLLWIIVTRYCRRNNEFERLPVETKNKITQLEL